AGSGKRGRQPDGDFPHSRSLFNLLYRAGRRKPLVAVHDDVPELVHGEDRHGMGSRIGKAHAFLRAAHLVGKRPAARHDDERQVRPRQRRDPDLHLVVAGRTAAELDDGSLHRVRPFLPCPWTASCVFSGCAVGLSAGFSLARLRSISTPTPPAPSSSFSTLTFTRTTRGSSSTCAAT